MRRAKGFRERMREKKRALYVHLPHVIRDEKDVAKLFTGDFKVNLTRQASKYCYVIFADVEEKMKNLKAAKNTLINGKRVVIASAITKSKTPTQNLAKKKVVLPPVKEDDKVTRTLFVSNIKCGTKLQELKEAIPGCVTAKMLKPYSQNYRGAMVKLETIQMAVEYLSQIRDLPVVRGEKLIFKPDTRIKRTKQDSNTTLKIYDGESEVNKDSNEKLNSKTSDCFVLEKKV
ncbi:uncharacterized protein LOC122400574 [Colletes gigas]|uniref:uncharacterized protein LOC122400574 n=1 Tax=Colletes gigas TaxID=935657 RepID=UPI001C9B28A7|nr:uncharacterized protein LOC122400574 [Colletes gigas]